MHAKYVDDLLLARSINLREKLVYNPNIVFNSPVNYRQRHCQELPENPLQSDLLSLEKYSEEHEMVINRKKTNVMLFNVAKDYDFMPQLSLSNMENGEHLDVVDSTKLLGVMIRSDLKWNENTDYICKKGYARLWVLRRLKFLGATIEEMFDIYMKQIRLVLELAVPLWHTGITVQ